MMDNQEVNRTSKLEVVFVMPNLSGGGAERVIVSLANQFVEKKVSARVLLTKDHEIAYKISNQVEILDYRNKFGSSAFGQIRSIRHAMKRYANAVFISFLPFQSIYGLLAVLGLKNRIIVSVRGYPPAINSITLNGIKPLIYLQNKLYEKVADKIVFQTKGQMLYFPQKAQNKGIVILNPLREDIAERVGSQRKVITTLGRLVDQKNHEMTLKAFKLFHEKHPDYRLEIYGKGPHRKRLELLGEELGISESICFAGFSSEAADKIASSSAFVMSSYYEGLSNGLIEAVSMGVPTVCAKCFGGGAVEVIDDGVNGILVDQDDVVGMAKSLNKIVEDAQFADSISQNARSTKLKFDIGHISEQWLKVVSDLNC